MVYALWVFAVVFQIVAVNVRHENGGWSVTQIAKGVFSAMSMTAVYFAATAP